MPERDDAEEAMTTVRDLLDDPRPKRPERR